MYTEDLFKRTPILGFYLFIIASAVLLRTIYTSPIEMGGDSLMHWNFAKAMAQDFNFDNFADNHHTMRWGTNIPTILFSASFGWGFHVYYVVPMLFFALFLGLVVLFCGLVGEKTHTYLIFLLLFFSEPMFYRASSQLIPYVFAAPFVLLHAIFLLKALRSRSQVFRLLAAFFIFVGYGAHENILLFVPGSCGYVLLALGWRRGGLLLINIGAYGLLMIAAETIFFDLISARPAIFGRLEFIGEVFRNVTKAPKGKFQVNSLWDLTISWFKLPSLTMILFLVALAGGVFLVFREKVSNVFNGISLPFFYTLSFILFHTFLLQSIDPVVPLAPPLTKYLANVSPWASLSAAFTFSYLITMVATGARLRRLQVGVLAVLGVICAVAITIPSWLGSFQPSLGRPHAGAWFWHADETYRAMSNAVALGFPVLVPKRGLAHLMENWFSAKLVQLGEHEGKRGRYVTLVKATAVDGAERRVLCVDLRSIRVQQGKWLIGCPITQSEQPTVPPVNWQRRDSGSSGDR